MIHFIALHWIRILAGWFVLSVLFVALWAVFLGESDEAKEARRRKERAEAAVIHLRRVTAVYVARRQREQGLLISKQGDDVFNQVSKEFNLDWYGLDHGNGTEVDGQPDQAA